MSLRTYLPDPQFDEANIRLRVKYLGDNCPAGTVICCPLLVPTWKLEIEAVAAKDIDAQDTAPQGAAGG